jgi:hypothetical protein
VATVRERQSRLSTGSGDGSGAGQVDTSAVRGDHCGVEPLALWGAVVGTAGAGIAVRREYLSGRRRLAVLPTTRLNASRVEPVGEIQSAFAAVTFWNTGGRELAVERIGFRFTVTVAGDGATRQMRAEIMLEAAIEAKVDGPSHKIYTPLGPMLAAGINPFALVEPFAVTTGEREWSAPPQPLIHSLPPMTSNEQLGKGLARLRDEAEPPPIVGEQIALKQELPVLPGEDVEG